MPQFILLDIEGTTTDIDFVHNVLFPYSAECLETYVQHHSADTEVQAALQMVKETVQAEDHQTLDAADNAQAVQVLLCWIRDDRKHTALKLLQGLIWKDGFEQKHYQGHVYADVPSALEAWKQQGIGLGIYSSGSVQAQRLLFGHSVAGDLTPYFSHYFDTNVGGKKDPASYVKIAQQLGFPPSDILFLSDAEEELDAAAQAGTQVIQLARKGPIPSKYPQVTSFAEINLAAASMLC